MRTFIAVAAAIAATSVTFAVTTAANQPVRPSASVTKTTATDRAILRQLKELNREVRTIGKGIGRKSILRDDLIEGTHQANLRLEKVCRAVVSLSDRYMSC